MIMRGSSFLTKDMRKARRFESIFRFIDKLCTIYKPETDLKKITKPFILMSCNSRRNVLGPFSRIP